MAKKDYSGFRNIKLSDLPIEFVVSNCSENYPKILSDNGITNLEELFEAYDNGIFNDGRKTGYKTLKGTIEILKNNYLGEPLIADSYLDLKIGQLEYGIFSDEIRYKIDRLGLTIGEINILGDYCRKKIENEENKYSNSSIINVMEDFLTDSKYHIETIVERAFSKYSSKKVEKQKTSEIESLRFKISILLKYKLKNKNIRLEYAKIIKPLKSELESLMSLRAGLDKQIELAEKEYNELTKKGRKI